MVRYRPLDLGFRIAFRMERVEFYTAQRPVEQRELIHREAGELDKKSTETPSARSMHWEAHAPSRVPTGEAPVGNRARSIHPTGANRMTPFEWHQSAGQCIKANYRAPMSSHFHRKRRSNICSAAHTLCQ